METIRIDCSEAPVIRQATHLEILQCVSSCCGVPCNLMTNSMRGKQNISDARHIAMYIIRRKCPLFSLDYIGQIFGGRDHSTVICAVAKIDGLLQVDRSFKKLFECCMSKINERLNYGTN